MKTKVDIIQMIDRLLDMEEKNSMTSFPCCRWKDSCVSSVVAFPDNWLTMNDQVNDTPGSWLSFHYINSELYL